MCALIACALMAPSHNSTSQRTTIGAVSGMPALTSRVWDIRTHEANGEGTFGVNSAANVFRSPSYTYDLPKRKHKRRVRTRNTDAALRGCALPLRRYLVVHLKRFFFEGALRDKIETPVQFPLRTLDLSRRAARAA